MDSMLSLIFGWVGFLVGAILIYVLMRISRNNNPGAAKLEFAANKPCLMF